MANLITWPVPASDRITGDYNERRTRKDGTTYYHKGIDIGGSTAGVKGNKILAATSGTVVSSRVSSSYGNVVYIMSDSKINGKYIKTVYAHMEEKLMVKKGDYVVAGTQVGTMGDSGSPGAVHLHFEVLEHNSRDLSDSINHDFNVNPLNYTSPTGTNSNNNSGSTTSGSSKIKEVQQSLNSWYRSGLTTDGLYGAKTRTALVKALQSWIGVTADGAFGPKTKAACPTLRSGATGRAVWILQAFLYCNKYDPNGLNSVYSNDVVRTVTSFQRNNGLSADGIAGPNTFEKICKK